MEVRIDGWGAWRGLEWFVRYEYGRWTHMQVERIANGYSHNGNALATMINKDREDRTCCMRTILRDWRS